MAHVHHFDVVAPSCQVQRRVALAVLDINMRSRLQQSLDHPRMVEFTGE